MLFYVIGGVVILGGVGLGVLLVLRSLKPKSQERSTRRMRYSYSDKAQVVAGNPDEVPEPGPDEPGGVDLRKEWAQPKPDPAKAAERLQGSLASPMLPPITTGEGVDTSRFSKKDLKKRKKPLKIDRSLLDIGKKPKGSDEDDA